LAPAPGLGSRIETRALEFFYKTAPQLAGLFAGEFFQGSVLKVSLVEPAIRQAMAAIGIVHEQAVSGRPSFNADGRATSKGRAPRKRFDPLNVPIQLYNRSIRAIIDKAITEPNSLPLIAMINILFTCFEYFQGNCETAAAHIRSGISLLQEFRETQGVSVAPWGTSYRSFEARFMEPKLRRCSAYSTSTWFNAGWESEPISL
jgi:hypothetical protein